jgi:glycine cleavage system H protein
VDNVDNVNNVDNVDAVDNMDNVDNVDVADNVNGQDNMNGLNNPDSPDDAEVLRDCRFTESHEWIRFLPGRRALIGITRYGQKLLGALVYLSLPPEDTAIEAGEAFAELASIRADSDVYCPVSGRITKVNTALLAEPERIAQAPYDAWMIEVSDVSEREPLLEARDYRRFLETEQTREEAP